MAENVRFTLFSELTLQSKRFLGEKKLVSRLDSSESENFTDGENVERFEKGRARWSHTCAEAAA